MAIPVLMYHALDEQRSAISIPPSTFERQMNALHEGGFNVIPLRELVSKLQAGEELPQRSVIITFDDGFESVYTHGLPILQKYGFPATMFLVSGYCGKSNDWPSQPAGIPRLSLSDWPQIREMERYGFEMGAHTHSHPRLDRVSPAELEREVVESKLVIEDKLGHEVNDFAYPYGRQNTNSAEIVSETYAGACTTYLSMVTSKSDPLALERVEALYLQNPRMVRLLANPIMPFYLGVRRLVRSTASSILGRDWE